MNRDVANRLSIPGKDRRNSLFGVVERAILSAVDERTAPDLAIADRLPKLLVKRCFLLATFQDARILADRFLACISGDALKGGVNIEDSRF